MLYTQVAPPLQRLPHQQSQARVPTARWPTLERVALRAPQDPLVYSATQCAGAASEWAKNKRVAPSLAGLLSLEYMLASPASRTLCGLLGWLQTRMDALPGGAGALRRCYQSAVAATVVAVVALRRWEAAKWAQSSSAGGAATLQAHAGGGPMDGWMGGLPGIRPTSMKI